MDPTTVLNCLETNIWFKTCLLCQLLLWKLQRVVSRQLAEWLQRCVAILHALKKIDTHEIPRGRPVPFPLTFPKGPATLLALFKKYDKCSQQISFSPAQRNDRPGGEGKLTITPELVVAAGSVSPTERVAEFPGGVGKQAFQLFSRLPHFSLVRHHTPAPCQLKQGWRWGWRLFLHQLEH